MDKKSNLKFKLKSLYEKLKKIDIFGIYVLIVFFLIFIICVLFAYFESMPWMNGLDGFTKVFYLLWLMLGIVIYFMFQNEYLKNFQKEAGQLIMSSGALLFIWAVFGSQFLNLGYWGSIADWFSGIGVVTLTAYLVYETINQRKEMERQRKLQQRPKLAPLNNYFEIRCVPGNTDKKYELTWKKRENKLSLSSDNLICGNIRIPYFEIYNLGTGFSKNIKLIFDVNYNTATDRIKVKNDLNVEYTPGDNNSGYLRVESDINGYLSSSSVQTKIRRNYEVLPPYDKKYLIIPLPDEILRIYEGVIITESAISYPINDPWYKLTIKYEDINGEDYSEEYFMTIIHAGRYYDEEKAILGSLSLEFTEIEQYAEKIKEEFEDLQFI
ncbi:hypothetical protein [Methanococcus maripaludis]|uniref:Uncharacterized protein n=1 Tax=Methanococcus maripaludis TaxID=39152 RepID=A0A2L1CBL9_METMI|nr:hypothetical protein [Methanococcus maripaludis]AVB76296.1 hypothetical protein MMJJ_08860 [Methanococcus maripaludis]